MLEVKILGKKRKKVQINLSDGDYAMLRHILIHTAEHNDDVNVRNYTKDILLPLLPSVWSR